MNSLQPSARFSPQRSRQAVARLATGLVGAIAMLTGCTGEPEAPIGRLTVGIVSYGEGSASLDQYQRFQQYLGEQTGALVELEPVYNEIQALEQIQRQSWSLVFAPPGLAAIAIDQGQYLPLFPLASQGTEVSVLVVRADSDITTLSDLQNKVVALGEPGSASGYYLPLYDLYGLTLAEIRFSPTPKTALEWLSQGEIDAAALSRSQFERYGAGLASTLRVIHQSRVIPPGSLLVGPSVDRNQEEVIRQALGQASSDIVGDAGYLATSSPPDYAPLIEFIRKVEPIEANIREMPAVLSVSNE